MNLVVDFFSYMLGIVFCLNGLFSFVSICFCFFSCLDIFLNNSGNFVYIIGGFFDKR